MNKAIIIGNLTRSPELKTVQVKGDSVSVCTFTVAVNKYNGDPTFVRVTAWRGLAETAAKYLEKGRKVAVVGEVSARAYTSRDGEVRASLELTAAEVEFLGSRPDETRQPDAQEGQFAEINDNDLPFA